MNDDIKSDIWVIGFNNEQGSYGIGLFSEENVRLSSVCA